MNEFIPYYSSLSGLKFIDLFCGIGGFHQALASFGASCVFSSEWDKHAQKTYYENFGIKPAGDITKIAVTDIPEHDILCAGFPCQPFSISGKQAGFNDTRGTLFFDIARIVAYHRPRLLILENVRNFTTHDEGRTLQTVKRTMNELGYDFYCSVLNASHYGLPQNRERIYMICIRRDGRVANFTFPKSSEQSISLADIILPDAEVEKYVIKRKDIVIDYDKADKITREAKTYNKPLRVGFINKGGQGERIYSEYGHAITLSAYGGGPGSKTGCYFIGQKVRKLAPRECARLQGFPDSFKITVSDSQAWKQFGNSIPINVLKHILKSIVDHHMLYQFLRPQSYVMSTNYVKTV